LREFGDKIFLGGVCRSPRHRASARAAPASCASGLSCPGLPGPAAFFVPGADPMILCGGPGEEFRCGDFICLLNDQFNIVLFSEHTILHGNVCKPLGFVVPVHYLSFVKTMNANHGLGTDLHKIFAFRSEAQAESLREYIRSSCGSGDYRVIRDLLPGRGPGIALDGKARTERAGVRGRRGQESPFKLEGRRSKRV